MSDNYAVRFIAHHGVKDQKWGRRRYQNRDGSLTPEGRLRYGKGGPRTKSGKPVITGSRGKTDSDASKPKKKSLSEMSDEEIQSQIARFKLEKEYNQLLKDLNPAKEKKSHKLISEIASASFKNIGTQAMTYAMGAAVNKVVKKAFNINYDIVNPKQGQSGGDQNKPKSGGDQKQGQSGSNQNKPKPGKK